MTHQKSAFLSAAEFLILAIMFTANYDLIISPSVIEDWQLKAYVSKISLFPTILLVLAFLHFTELGKRARHRYMYFREAPNQGFVLGSVVSLCACMQHLKCYQEPSRQEGEMDSLLSVYKTYTLAMSVATLFYEILYLLNIDIAFVAPVVMLSLGFLQDHFTDINFIVPLGAVILYFVMVFGMIKLCPRSFTIAEAAMISQGATLMVIDFTLLVVMKSGYQHLLHGYQLDALDGRLNESSALSALLTSAILISVCLSPVFYCLTWFTKTSRDTLIYSVAFYVGGIMNTLAIFFPATLIVVGANPLSYIASLLTKSVSFLIAYWVLLLLVSVAVVVWNTDYNTQSGRAFVPNIVIRKFFHFVAVLIFVPGIHFEPDFTKFASGVAIVILLICEYLRIFKIYPFGEILDRYMLSFVDERDCGKVILTHIYLLFGFSLPVWLFPFNSESPLCILLPYSGVISVGIGDSFASIIGSLYGISRIPGSSKTYLGFAACTTCQFLFSIVLVICLHGYVPLLDCAKILAAVCFTAAMECVTSQIDNLILPPFLYATLSLLFVGSK